jgi:4'-phosphopantetheinyl transferase
MKGVSTQWRRRSGICRTERTAGIAGLEASWVSALTSPCGLEVSIWWIALDRSGDGEAVLTHQDRLRAAAYRDERDRARFVESRSAMRKILSRYTGTAPKELVFAVGAHGKPYICGRQDVYFNLAHSNDLAGLAVTRSGQVGLDCECVKRLEGLEALCRRVCSPHEHALIRRNSEYEECGIFYRIWTRKEAVVKAMGIGLDLPIAGFTVLRRLSDASAIVELPGLGKWDVFDIEAPVGYAGACCIYVGGPLPA